MAKPSVFRDFMSALKKRWKIDCPFIQPLQEAVGTMPKASSFHAGATQNGLSVYLYFQHSVKAWRVGQFTINVALAKSAHHSRPAIIGADSRFGEGHHRIGYIVGNKDKWWYLREYKPLLVVEGLPPVDDGHWEPSAYSDVDVVIDEAVADVSRDVLNALQILGVKSQPNRPDPCSKVRSRMRGGGH